MSERILKVKILLEGLHTDIEFIHLTGDYLIRTPEESELAELAAFNAFTKRLATVEPSRFKILEKEFPAKEPWGVWPKYAAELATVITALRLFKHGTVGYRLSLYELIPKPKYQGLATMYDTSQAAFAEGEYKLSKNEIGKLQSFWSFVKDALYKAKEIKSMNLAMSRFEISYSRRQLPDKFIDLMISMEALYLKKDEVQELSYRLSQRAALIIGLERDNRDRILTKKRIKKLYRKRSQIVHGESTDVSFQEVVELKNYVRTSIKKFLTFLHNYNGHTRSFREKILDAVDELVLLNNNISIANVLKRIQ